MSIDYTCTVNCISLNDDKMLNFYQLLGIIYWKSLNLSVFTLHLPFLPFNISSCWMLIDEIIRLFGSWSKIVL